MTEAQRTERLAALREEYQTATPVRRAAIDEALGILLEPLCWPFSPSEAGFWHSRNRTAKKSRRMD